MMDESHAPTIRVLRLRPERDADLPLPSYMSAGAAGLDLRAAVRAPLLVPSLGRVAVPTGLALGIPPGWEGQVRPRSGLALHHGLTVINAPGTIDSDYRGEVAVLLINLGPDPMTIERGQRIAQLVIAPAVQARLVEVTDLDETGRGASGFGSTGSGDEK